MMMKKGIYAFLAALAVFAMVITSCPGEEEVWSGGRSELKSLSIAGNTAVLGTPHEKADQALPGSVSLKSGLTDENDEPILAVNSPAIIGSPSNYTIKYAVTSDANAPEADVYLANKPSSLKHNDYLWLQVTDKSTLYYVIKITVVFNDVFAIKGHPASREFTLAGWNAAGSAQTLTVEMEIDSPKYTYQWYSNTVFTNTGGAKINDAESASYTPDNFTALGNYYYYVTVTNSRNTTITSNVAWIKISSSITPAPLEFTIGSERLNYVRGVGGTGSFMFREGDRADASPDADVRYIELLMGELGSNILRIMVQDDYLNYIDNKVQSKNVDVFPHDARRNFFAVIRKVNEYGGYVFANPWTAPKSMKVTSAGGTTASENLAGGYLRQTPSNYVDYAEHLRDFLKWLNTNDAPIFALGILNEPDFGGAANYEGMGMTGEVTRDWFRTVGNFPTQKVTNKSTTSPGSSTFEVDIIPGYGGGGPTHHVLAMSGDVMGNIAGYMDPQLSSINPRTGSNNKIELMGRHYYTVYSRYTRVAGNPPHHATPTAWFDRPQLEYVGPYEAESLAQSPQMYAPGSTAGNIKREIWQTEHDFNYHSNSTTPPASNVQNFWNSAFAALNDVDWCLRVNGESVFDWWYSSSYSGLVTSYQEAGFPPYTITPRGRAFAHYARYVNETWFLPINRTRGDIVFNRTGSAASPAFDAGATDPKINAFEDVNGKFISVVMFTPCNSTAGATGGAISSSFGQGGTSGNDNPTLGSREVGRIAVVLPDGFVASSASAIRTYGNGNATSEDAGWTAAKPVPAGSPRYWIDEPAFLSADGKSVEVYLPAGNVISIMIKGEWPGRTVASPERKRPYTVQ